MKLKGKSVFKYTVNNPTPVQMLLRSRRQEGQSIIREEFSIDPVIPFVEFIDQFGNQCQRAVLPVGEVTITMEAEALVEPGLVPPQPLPAYVPVEELPDEVMMFLLPSRYCQSDLYEINNLAFEIVGNLDPGYAQVEAIRNWIHQNISYQYNTSSSVTTALDTIYQRVGVCRDFTHLGLALTRSLSIPARMTVGYLDKLEYMDLHAWFDAFVGGKWYTFDAVQAQTHGSRIVIGYGRDAADVAMITQFGNAQLQSLEVTTEEITD